MGRHANGGHKSGQWSRPGARARPISGKIGPRRRRRSRLTSQLVIALLGALGAAGAAVAEPLPLVLPPGFRADLVADGLGAPRLLVLDPSGALLVSVPSTGRIVALPPDPGRERLRAPVTVVDGLNLPHGLIVGDGHLWVAETGRVLRFRYDVVTHSAREPVVIAPHHLQAVSVHLTVGAGWK